MEKIVVTPKQLDWLIDRYQLLIENIVIKTGNEVIITDNIREQIATCSYTLDFHNYKKSVFIRSDWKEYNNCK